MLFEQSFWPGIADGSITLTFRRWKGPRAVAGRRHRVPGGMIEIDDVRQVDPESITDDDASRAGYRNAVALAADLRGEPDQPLFRVAFHHVGIDPRTELAAADRLTDEQVAELDKRLARLDAASRHGPWTAATLAAIASRPGVRAGDLAEGLGRERDPFKVDVRKLKNLGLTLSLEVGYRLSPRGIAYRRARGERAD
ncbi:hypothetical protein [Pseudonocardia acaciae]|uniref:hypothetical protein n=1 Tax=Pseudonocardia acaciae TaxID=551276 RepID=UPI0005667816|nr:hypothetical protein [Pseudonocardia acaciae]